MENRKDYGPHLICGLLTRLSNLYSEFNKWLLAFNVIQYTRIPEERKQKANSYLAKGSNVNVVLTSYEFATRDRATLGRLYYSYLIIDKAYYLKNDQSKLGQAISDYKCDNRLVTPLQNNPRELWLLNNSDNSQFEEWSSDLFSKAGGGCLINWRRTFLISRTTTEVATELPEMRKCKLLRTMSAWKKVVFHGQHSTP
ncbi:SNF2 family N-terminal domain containing protein [Trichomonas vaginalis G3]|uniref:SNF2 family N-terminal domain containing protein n=1 Tax=Trichomonas vaginalis (strain ATCC PRA-98 / G3) TaxID=412133 RepID=A2ERH0_TRIV3|nr:aortic smooth muscle cell differentiation protein family [Trichomonas vaginalis G3]EAY04773.1 SNF2 family N-terminal domain containing protein [Trichomonas vaginalis G3]KAI5545738.1 aortic smooth muscle cell differentiation protein family [Trichomonas vaginalis G3]|eukprot:XP_001316996.1 SNF2 family N-terminal domain containing protein [Trichomonas vaginalis G3]